jgi:hypothetical protein
MNKEKFFSFEILMNQEKEKILEKEPYLEIKNIIEKEGKENLEKIEIKKEIKKNLENLLLKVRKEEKETLNNYLTEIGKEIKKIRENFEKEFNLNILETEKEPEAIIYEQHKLEETKITPVKEHISPEETKTKNLIKKISEIFKKTSDIRKWLLIFSLSLGSFYPAASKIEKLPKETKIELIKNELLPLTPEERKEFEKIISIEENKEISPLYLNWDLNELSEVCKKIKYLHELLPKKKEIGYLLESDDKKIGSLFNEINRYFYQNEICWFLNKSELKIMLESWLNEAKFLDKEILAEEKNEVYLPRYLASTKVDFIISEVFGNYYQITLNVIDTKNSAILNQFFLKIKPEDLEKRGLAQFLQEKIIEKTKESIKKIKTEKEIFKLPKTELKEEFKTPYITLDKEKLNQFSKEEKEIFEKNPEYFKDFKITFIIEDEKGFQTVEYSPSENVLKKPIKIKGKIASIRIKPNLEKMEIDPTLPLFDKAKKIEEEYKLTFNSQTIFPIIDPKEGLIYKIGNFNELYGTLISLSPEKEVNISLEDKNGKKIAEYVIEQTQEWLMDHLYYQNVFGLKDSIGIYVVDPETLQIYQKFDKKEIINYLTLMAEGAVDVEKYFDIDLNIERIKIGSSKISTALFYPWEPKSLACSILEIQLIQQKKLTEDLKKEYFRYNGRHEAFHKLDYLLGGGFPLSSLNKEFFNFYQKLLKELSLDLSNEEEITKKWFSLKEKEKKESLFYYITEGEFFKEFQTPLFGHPYDNERELFASLLNSTIFTNKERLKTEFLKWPKKIRNDYLEGLTIVEKMLKECGLKTEKLLNTIAYLKSLNK